ncbi:MAG: HEPN domain-containing protein [Phycisphaerae bacterium]|nr:HEPN domain-containing protein [Phycisphaerae bacterium]
MNEVVREWIEKAEGDYLTATREVRADPPNYDAGCFHAQQCVEKLMKAAIIVKDQIPPKTHDLTVLSGLLNTSSPEWHWPVEELRLLSRSAVIFRYPGESAGREEADAALSVATAMRERLLSLLQRST